MLSKIFPLIIHLIPRALFAASAVAGWLDKPLHAGYFFLLGGLGFVMEIADNTARIPKSEKKENA